MHPPPHSSASRWLPITGVAAVYTSFGTVIGSMASLVDEISVDLELSRSAMGSILGAWALVYVFTAIPAGAVVDRFGVRRSIALGSLSMIVSLLVRASATGPIGLFVGVAVFGIGGPLISVSAPKLTSTLFEEDARRLPTGLLTAAPGLGSVIGLALTTPVLLPVTGDRWRVVLVLFAVLAAATGGSWLALSRRLASDATAVSATNAATFRRLLALPFFRLILVMGLVHFLFSHAFSAWLPEILTSRGFSDTHAGYLAAASSGLGIAGAILLPRLIPQRFRTAALAVIFALMAATAAGLLVGSGIGLLVAVGLMGMARAGVIPLLFLLIMDHPGVRTREMGAATGLFFAVGEVGGYFGPLLVGLFADWFGGFGAAVVALAIAAATGAVVSVAARGANTGGFTR